MPSEARVLILWGHLPGYLAACLKVLLAEYNLPVFVIVKRPDSQPNHTRLQRFSDFKYLDLSSSDCRCEAEVKERVTNFRPTILVVSSAKWGLFTRLAKIAKKQGALTIWATDHYWKGSWRDYANSLLAKLGIIYGNYDAAWMPGFLGRQYALQMGFDDKRIFENVLSCDAEIFRRVGTGRFDSEDRQDWPEVFLFVGQYIHCKNLDTLLKAYSMYREGFAGPWHLWCAGSGPLSHLLKDRPGVTDLGYQSSESCAELMGRSGAFILPSRVDHWGVVIHEAACAGLPVLSSRGCGAATHLVRDGYNGYTFPPEDAGMLANLMQHISEQGRAEAMGKNSLRMSYQFDPKLWAKTLVEEIPFCLPRPI